MVKADNSGNSDNPSFNIPASKYYWLGDYLGAAPKWMIKSFTPILIFTTFIATSVLWLTDWWQTLAVYLLTTLYLGALWPVGWGGSFIMVGGGYLWYTRRQKRLIRERAEATQRNKIRKLIDGA